MRIVDKMRSPPPALCTRRIHRTPVERPLNNHVSAYVHERDHRLDTVRQCVTPHHERNVGPYEGICVIIEDARAETLRTPYVRWQFLGSSAATIADQFAAPGLCWSMIRPYGCRRSESGATRRSAGEADLVGPNEPDMGHRTEEFLTDWVGYRVRVGGRPGPKRHIAGTCRISGCSLRRV